ncbi:MAG: ParB/RepB/Spo0J family partition protein [Prevotellaceae bacterium]|nr:ParB/RepB/Spo0J family partition protein [Candidatus Faecinaster equi]
MAVHKKYPALGRGLDALISNDDVAPEGTSSISEIEINKIEANPDQPRREIDASSLEELAESISQIGIIQPITLRKTHSGKYQIIAGERRWRASSIAGKTTIPAYIIEADDQNVMQMALVENIQREDLNPIEIALAYNNLMQKLNLTQEAVAEKVGKKRATVTNYLRLLKLPAPVQIALRNKKIDQGHARAILGIESPAAQVKLFNEIQKHGYSVRKVEELVQAMNEKNAKTKNKKKKVEEDALSDSCIELREKMTSFFNVDVAMTCSANGKGRITIPFNTEDDLERLLKLFENQK